MKRYLIMGRMVGAAEEAEVCQVDGNAEHIAEALRQKTTSGRGRLPIYELVRVVDRQAAEVA